jgi:predicted porin
MKKTLIALAALSATAAFAQSTVTLSGTLDAGLEKTANDKALSLANSRNGTTQLTFAGTEDLGGGLKARFQISTAFDSTFDTAAADEARAGSSSSSQSSKKPSTIGDNGMFIAMDTPAGSFIVGRPVNTLYGMSYTANGTKGVTGYAATSSITSSGVYTANAIQYVSPNFSGVTVQLEYAPSENVNTRSTTSIGVRYAAGPVGVSLVYDQARANEAGEWAWSKILQLAGSYDFGAAKVSATYQKLRSTSDAYNEANSASSDTAFVLGLNVPMGAGQIWAQYGVAETIGSDARVVGLGYKYSLSKRTTAYVNLGNRNSAGGKSSVGYAASGSTSQQTKGTGYGIGLQHNF